MVASRRCQARPVTGLPAFSSFIRTPFRRTAETIFVPFFTPCLIGQRILQCYRGSRERRGCSPHGPHQGPWAPLCSSSRHDPGPPCWSVLCPEPERSSTQALPPCSGRGGAGGRRTRLCGSVAAFLPCLSHSPKFWGLLVCAWVCVRENRAKESLTGDVLGAAGPGVTQGLPPAREARTQMSVFLNWGCPLPWLPKSPALWQPLPGLLPLHLTLAFLGTPRVPRHQRKGPLCFNGTHFVSYLGQWGPGSAQCPSSTTSCSLGDLEYEERSKPRVSPPPSWGSRFSTIYFFGGSVFQRFMKLRERPSSGANGQALAG